MTFQLFVNLLIFLMGMLGIVLNRQSLILILMSLELSLLSLNLTLICFSTFFDDIIGQIFSIIILTVAAAESAIGLAIFILHYRLRGNIAANNIPSLRF